jgi:CubicO group peptidase (beta-lactamase class C family)
MRVGPLQALMEILLNKENHEIHCILVVKDNLLVFEEYFAGHDFSVSRTNYHGTLLNFDRNTAHNLHSATKSITATLLGIAIDKGYVNGVAEKVYDFFPQYDHLRTTMKNRIRLSHLLNMRAGWAWNEWDTPVASNESNYMQMLYSNDPLGFVLGQPMDSEPGSKFNYSGGVTNVLGQVVESSVPTSFERFADQVLFEPLGITNRRWPRFPSGMILVSGDLHIRPRDMAKIGSLIINNGRWQGQQLVSEKWIGQAIQQRVDLPMLGWAEGYGYQWWFQTFNVNSTQFDTFRAEGWGGQIILQVPQLNMVVVFTGANYTTEPNPSLRDMIQSHVLLSAMSGN